MCLESSPVTTPLTQQVARPRLLLAFAFYVREVTWRISWQTGAFSKLCDLALLYLSLLAICYPEESLGLQRPRAGAGFALSGLLKTSCGHSCCYSAHTGVSERRVQFLLLGLGRYL